MPYFEKAEFYHPIYPKNLRYLMECNFILKRFDVAYNYSSKLLQLKHPTEERALMTSIHTALEAGFYENALHHVIAYVQKNPENAVVNEIHQRLLNNDRVEQLTDFFLEEAPQ